jgi:hypothetical protein
MHRFLAYFFLIFAALTATAAAQQCMIDTRAVVRSSPYFMDQFKIAPGETQASLTLQMKDDPRIVVNFAMESPLPSEKRSISQYLKLVRAEFTSYINAVKAEGRWIELTTFPYEPLAWRVVEEAKLADVGPSLVGRMYIRLSEDCLLAANFISPSNINLRSRWHAFSDAIANLRTDAGALASPTEWADEDTTPTGVMALAIGYASPMFCAIAAFFLLGHLTRLDRPSLYTRIVLACIGAIMFGSIAYQWNAYAEEFKHIRYTDNALLLATTGLLCFVALGFNQTMTVLALVTACITGLTLVSLSFFEWTPDPNISLVVGGAILTMGVLGFLAWSMGDVLETRKPIQRDFD